MLPALLRSTETSTFLRMFGVWGFFSGHVQTAYNTTYRQHLTITEDLRIILVHAKNEADVSTCAELHHTIREHVTPCESIIAKFIAECDQMRGSHANPESE